MESRLEGEKILNLDHFKSYSKLFFPLSSEWRVDEIKGKYDSVGHIPARFKS